MRHDRKSALWHKLPIDLAKATFSVQTTILTKFYKTVKELGGDPDVILRKAQITPRNLFQEGAVLPASRIVRLMELAAHDLNVPEFGRRLAHEQAKIAYSGTLIATLFANCPTLRHWFLLLDLTSRAYNPFIDLQIIKSRRCDVVVFNQKPINGSMRQICELTIMGCAFQVERLSHAAVIREIHLTYSEVAPVVWKSELDEKVRYCRSRNALIFEPGALDVEISGVDHTVFKETQSQLNSLFPNFSGTTICNSTRWRLLSGEDAVKSEEMADCMRLSPRTFRRRLSEEGETFTNIKLDFIKDKALNLVMNMDIPLKDISGQLGYSNQASLTRSFRRWFHVTPSQVRRNGGLD